MAEGLADDAGDTVLVMRGASTAGRSAGTTQNKNRKKTDKIRQRQATQRWPANLPASPQKNANRNRGGKSQEFAGIDDPAFNIPVHPGDIVKVTRAGSYNVVGEVKKPAVLF